MYVPEPPERSRVTRVLIANRGEIASRIIRTCQTLGISTVAIYTAQDQNAEFWQSADIQHYAGDLEAEGNPYMDGPRMINIAKQYQVDAVHPGYGFLSESSAFAKQVVDAGFIWIGPSHETIALLGDKAACKEFLQKHADGRVPLIPGGVAQALHSTTQTVEKIGLPVLLKAAAGGGGRGMRVITSMSDLQHNLDGARAEAKRLFGSDELLLEKYLPDCKHVEVQMFGDGVGDCRIFGDRDCSVQRRHQKVIEECPAVISQKIKEVLYEAARTIARITKYVNAATIEFLVDVKNERAYFLEVNTRIQVEHPVSEEVFGLDLVALQIFIAGGGQLENLPSFTAAGHSIQLRLYAEDPYQNYLPQSGLVTYFSTGKAAARFESAVKTGQTVSFSFDPLITKIIVTADTRQAAVKKALTVCRNVVCLGLQTNQPFLEKCLSMAAFRDNTYDTSFIGKHLSELLIRPVCDKSETIAVISTLSRALKKRPREPSRLPRFSEELIDPLAAAEVHVRRVSDGTTQGQDVLEIRTVGQLTSDTPDIALNKEGYKYVKRLYDTKNSPVLAIVRVNVLEVRTLKLTHGYVVMADLVVDGRRSNHIATISKTADGVDTIFLNGHGKYIRRSALVGFGSLDNRQTTGHAGVTDYKAPMPGRVIRIETASGSKASVGQCILVLESMKTEVRILSHSAGTVDLMVKNGDVVDAGTVLAVVATDDS